MFWRGLDLARRSVASIDIAWQAMVIIGSGLLGYGCARIGCARIGWLRRGAVGCAVGLARRASGGTWLREVWTIFGHGTRRLLCAYPPNSERWFPSVR